MKNEQLGGGSTEPESGVLFSRTRELGYDERLKALSAEENGGEAALIVQPFEGILWYVDEARPVVSDATQLPQLIKLADSVIEWTTVVAKNGDGVPEAQANGGPFETSEPTESGAVRLGKKLWHRLGPSA